MSKSIIVVEDNDDLVMLYCDYFSALGYDVQHLGSAQYPVLITTALQDDVVAVIVNIDGTVSRTDAELLLEEFKGYPIRCAFTTSYREKMSTNKLGKKLFLKPLRMTDLCEYLLAA